MIHHAPTRLNPAPPTVGLLHEHPEWTRPLHDALTARGIDAVELDATAFTLDLDADTRSLDLPPVVLNRISPSAGDRGHESAIGLARAALPALEVAGVRVLNGSRAFAIETSKAAQQRLLRQVGAPTPRSMLLARAHDAAPMARARGLTGPFILKPDTGGSGVGVVRAETLAELEFVAAEADRASNGHGPWILQPAVTPAGGTIDRLEYVGGELVLAMRVHPRNTFNLCPAEACVRPAATDDRPVSVEFEPWSDPPRDVVALGRRIVETAGLDVGGIEFITDTDGTPWVIDVNATSVYRREIAEAMPREPLDALADFLRRAARPARSASGAPRTRVAAHHSGPPV